ncbi:hypothetical protein [Enterococcus raffinosus]|uniref:hypothetical protein n=1 Tax=Enterococcus raffinosus TaxID=71452 RepID=UPI0021BBE02F|nr:hypothetical protein [Enterococcus raffinosus]
MKKNAVVYCTTGSHIQLAAVSIASIVKNYKSKEPIDLLIIVDKLDTNDILKLKKFRNCMEIKIFQLIFGILLKVLKA